MVLAAWLQKIEMSSPAMQTFLFGYRRHRDWSGAMGMISSSQVGFGVDPCGSFGLACDSGLGS